MPAGPVSTLTPQQQTFVEEYAKDRNAVRAALAAGLSDRYFSAAEAGSQLLKKPEIRKAVKAVLRVQAKRLKTEVPDVVREWAILGKSDLDDYELTADGRLVTRPGVPKSAMRAVKKVKLTRTERLTGRGDAQELTVEHRAEIELHAKEGPLTKLYEHLHGVLPGEAKAGGMTIDDAIRLRDDLARRGRVAGDVQQPVPVVPEAGAAEPRVPQ